MIVISTMLMKVKSNYIMICHLIIEDKVSLFKPSRQAISLGYMNFFLDKSEMKVQGSMNSLISSQFQEKILLI